VATLCQPRSVSHLVDAILTPHYAAHLKAALLKAALLKTEYWSHY
jgi:hypothetical protein